MADLNSFLYRWTPPLLSVLRIVAAFLFMQHGGQKLFDIPPSGRPPAAEPFQLLSWFGIAGVLELFGGLLILLGLFTRPVAFILSGEMAVAYFRSHAPPISEFLNFPKELWPVLN